MRTIGNKNDNIRKNMKKSLSITNLISSLNKVKLPHVDNISYYPKYTKVDDVKNLNNVDNNDLIGYTGQVFFNINRSYPVYTIHHRMLTDRGIVTNYSDWITENNLIIKNKNKNTIHVTNYVKEDSMLPWLGTIVTKKYSKKKKEYIITGITIWEEDHITFHLAGSKGSYAVDLLEVVGTIYDNKPIRGFRILSDH